nr:MAG TPA: hypothetical protein [Caudoviricetes sp.]
MRPPSMRSASLKSHFYCSRILCRKFALFVNFD